MIDAVNVPVQTVALNGNVLFANTRIRTGCSVRHEQGSGRFIALKPGVYSVTYSGNVSIPTGGALVPISLDLTADGDTVAGARILLPAPAAVNTPTSVSRTVLIRVFCECCVALAVRNTGTGAINIQDANFVITREC